MCALFHVHLDTLVPKATLHASLSASRVAPHQTARPKRSAAVGPKPCRRMFRREREAGVGAIR